MLYVSYTSVLCLKTVRSKLGITNSDLIPALHFKNLPSHQPDYLLLLLSRFSRVRLCATP